MSRPTVSTCIYTYTFSLEIPSYVDTYIIWLEMQCSGTVLA